MSVFYVKTAKIRWQLGATPQDPLGFRRLGATLPDPRLCTPLCQILSEPLYSSVQIY